MIIIKQMFKEPRPNGCGTGYGMPSAHTSAITIRIFYWQIENLQLYKNDEKFIKSPLMTLFTVFACLVGFSRFYLQYHTKN